MTLGEVISGILNGKFQRFSNIPAEHLSTKVAELWVENGLGSLYDIPDELINDEVRIAAMAPASRKSLTESLVIESFMNIKPWQTRRYEELALLGIKRTIRVFGEVADEYLTKDFLIKALTVNSGALMPLTARAKKRIEKVVDNEVVELAASRSAGYLLQFDHHQITEKAVKDCITHQCFDYQVLVDIGRYQVLVDMIREGFWPKDRPAAPDSLESGIQRFLPMQECLLHRAYILQFPIQDVIANMDTPSRRLALLQLYSAEELTPYLKTKELSQDKAFKGRLLESEMGL